MSEVKKIIFNRGPKGLDGKDGDPGPEGPEGTTATTDITYADLAAPSSDTLASRNVYRTPIGTPVISDGDKLRALGGPRMGRTIVLFQSSGGARGNAVKSIAPGGIVSNGRKWTVQTNDNLLQHSNAWVLLGASEGGTQDGVDGQTVLAQIRRTGTKSFEIDHDGPAGTNTIPFDLLRQSEYAHPSIFREINRLAGGMFTRLATWAVGGQNTAQKLSQYQKVLALKPDCGWGDMGANNDALDFNIPLSTTLANIDTMLIPMLASGIEWFWPTSPAIWVSTPARVARSKRIEAHIRELARDWPNLIVIDQFADTVDPATGLSYPGLIADELFHQSQEGAGVYGRAAFEAMQASGRINRGWPDPLIASAQDRRSQDPLSPQIYEGGWDSVGIDAATLDPKAVGKVDAACGDIVTTGNNGRLLTTDLVLREDGLGYDTWGTFAATAGDTMQISFVGPPGALLKDLVQPSGKYFVGCDFAIWQDVPGTVRAWELVVDSQFSYAGASNAYGRLCAYNTKDTNAAEPPMQVAAVGPAYFPDCDLPAFNTCQLIAVTLFIQHELTGITHFRIGRTTFKERT